MIGVGWTIKTEWFGDRLHDRFIAAASRELRGASAYLRSVARNSIRRRKRKSRPGQTPTNQTGGLKRFIAFERRNGDPLTYLIGAQRTKAGDIPGRLETGGVARIRTSKRARRRDPRAPAVVSVRIAPRPFMRPALDKTLSQKQFAGRFRGII